MMGIDSADATPSQVEPRQVTIPVLRPLLGFALSLKADRVLHGELKRSTIFAAYSVSPQDVTVAQVINRDLLPDLLQVCLPALIDKSKIPDLPV